jgi:hypothetical protein
MADGTITLGKLSFPLVQSANNFGGGYRQADTTSTYALGFYMAGNGLAVFGAGTPGTINAGIIIGQTGAVSFGAVSGAARLNLMQASDAESGGFRIYHSNTTAWASLWVDSSGHTNIGATANGAIIIRTDNRYVGIGLSGLPSVRLHISQSATAEGIRLDYGGGTGNVHVEGDGRLTLKSLGTSVQCIHSSACFAPSGDNTTGLGNAAFRWSNVRAMTATFDGAVGFSSNINVGGTFQVTGQAQFDGTAILNGNVVGPSSGPIITSTGIKPNVDNAGNCGVSGTMWGGLWTHNGYKPGGGQWSDSSDDRFKDPRAFRPYTDGLEKLKLLNPVYFKYNGDYGLPTGKEFVGFRAQQLKGTHPDLVEVLPPMRKRPNDETCPEDTDMLGTNATRITFMLINAVKELATRLDALERRN